MLPLALLWLAALMTVLWVRPLFPVDETRYAAVAWEMWSQGRWLVPHLNGEPYPDKPPLLFWLIHLGWLLTGVNEWWPRLLPALFGLLNLVLTAHLARLLWPQQPQAARLAPWILFGSGLWLWLHTPLQFDMPLAAGVLLALIGVLRAAHGARHGAWLCGLGLGLGMLAKGPVALVPVLPAALLAPVWLHAGPPHGWLRWYAGVLGAVLLGAVLALAWALPAAVAGGAEYRQAILWEQSAGRMIESFAHRQPWWWYLPWLAVILLPWSLWPRLWRAARDAARAPADTGLRFCLAWLLPALLVFSLISGKQLKYLLPLAPGFALLAAAVLSRQAQRRATLRLPGVALAVFGAFVAAAPWVYRDLWWVAQAHPGWGAALVAAGIAVTLQRPVTQAAAVRTAVLGMVLVLMLGHLGLVRLLAPAYDVTEASRLVGRFQEQGRAAANLGVYHGQFHFAGRLTHPVTEIATADSEEARAWAAANPAGYVVAYHREWGGTAVPEAVHAQPYRNGGLILWRAETILKHPHYLDAGSWPGVVMSEEQGIH